MGLRPVLIGIHGLGNKPPPAMLADWWLRAIRESFALFGTRSPAFRFEMVYWADLLHEVPLDPNAPPGHPLFCENPYVPYAEPPRVRKPSRLRRLLLDELERILEHVGFSDSSFINLDRIGDQVIQALFRDLEIYYYGTCIDRQGKVRPARDVIREELARVLHRHRRENTVLLAHSMGTIIAYDVLSDRGYGVSVDALVTVGSPLGLPPIMRKHMEEGVARSTLAVHAASDAGGVMVAAPPASGPGQPPFCHTPEGVRRRWVNISDLQDQVALNYDLADDYGPSARGVAAEDVVVYNTYRSNRHRDTHNIFGYIRTPEAAKLLATLLTEGRRGWLRAAAGALGRLAR